MTAKKGRSSPLTPEIHSSACSTVAVAFEAPSHATASPPSTENVDWRWLFVPHQTTERSNPKGRAFRLSWTVPLVSTPGNAIFPPRCHLPKSAVV